MKLHTLIASLLLSLLFLSNCKKGKDDPAFSFLTRKARLVGEWRMKQGSVSLTYMPKTGAPYNESYAFDGSNLTLNTTETGTPIIYVGKYTLNLTFKKDGTFTMNELISGSSGSSLKASGTWNFTGKVGKAKNKDAVSMRITEVSSGGTGNHLFNKFSMEFTYSLTELRNKELAIESSGGIYYGVNDDQLNYRNIFKFENTKK